MANSHPKWNFKEFSAFTLIYAAHADQVFSEKEKEMILTKVDENKLAELLEVFENASDQEVMDIISSYKGLYFPTSDRKNELVEMIIKQFKADGHFSQIEKSLLVALERIL